MVRSSFFTFSRKNVRIDSPLLVRNSLLSSEFTVTSKTTSFIILGLYRDIVFFSNFSSFRFSVYTFQALIRSFSENLFFPLVAASSPVVSTLSSFLLTREDNETPIPLIEVPLDFKDDFKFFSTFVSLSELFLILEAFTVCSILSELFLILEAFTVCSILSESGPSLVEVFFSEDALFSIGFRAVFFLISPDDLGSFSWQSLIRVSSRSNLRFLLSL